MTTSATPIQPLPRASAYRTHTCSELRDAHIGQEVMLSGAIDKVIDPSTYEIRDPSGATLIRMLPGLAEAELAGREMKNFSLETVLQVKGKVVKREKPDPAQPSGGVRVEVTKLEVLSFAVTPLLFDFRAESLPLDERVRHRYLYLRKPAVHENFRFRTRVQHEARLHLVGERFEEVETPILANKWNPEQTEAFLAVRNRKEIFALPGTRPIHGAALMASGFDRVFEVARRFRRKASYGPFQQPEFSVLDIHAAYVGEGDLHRMTDALFAHLWKTCLPGEPAAPITDITFEDAWVRYGSDAPDLRFDLPITDVTRAAAPPAPASRPRFDLEAGLLEDPALRTPEAPASAGTIRAIRVPAGPAGAGKLGEKEIAALGKLATAVATLHAVSVLEGGKTKQLGLGALEEPLAARIAGEVGAGKGDVLLVARSADRQAAAALAGAARLSLGRALGLRDRPHALVRVTRPPFYRFDGPSGQWRLTGNPLSRAVDEDLDGDPHRMREQAFYLVLDGVNVGGGGLRNHDLHAQRRLLAALGFKTAEIDVRFGQTLELLRFAAPPWGRIAIGVDRLCALMRGLDGIEEMIPLPKKRDGTDPLTRSPWPIDTHVVKGMFGV